MKYSFEMVGLFPGYAEAVPTGDGVLAKTRWKRLGLAEETGVVERVTKGTAGREGEDQELQRDAVE